MATINAEPTPNPDSLKFTTSEGSFLKDGMVSYSSKAEAEDHPLAHRLFSVSGVEDVFITPGFVTVSKRSAADWTQTKPKVESILQDHLDDA